MSPDLQNIPWARRLKLRHLEIFLALHDEGSLTAAAARLHMTQPAMSHWLADIEEAVGHPLFARKPKFMLTAVGQVLLAHARRMLGDVQRTDSEMQAVQAGLSGRLHVGTSLPSVLVPRAIARLLEGRPEVFAEVYESNQAELMDKLSKCEIDLTVAALTAPVLNSGFACERLFFDRVQVVATQGHPLLRQASVSLEEVRNHAWILPRRSTVMREVFDSAFAAHGLPPPEPHVEANSSMRLQVLIAAGGFLSIFSGSEVNIYCSLGLIERMPMTMEIPFGEFGAIWSADRAGSLINEFLDALRKEAHLI
ncbi:LysR family transcriptional regulator [Variovorax defluvii]|uniref:LysR family transcriptional regulator n=1 Tax=Variovorax defluvii TaxID=913761 RepID=UPI0031EE6EAC